jgi:hypothetical protein
MNWLRRIILLGLLSTLAILVLRRREAPAAPGDDAAPEWPPLSIASGSSRPATPAVSSSSLWRPPENGACPDGYPIKVAKSGIYHVPDGLSYARTYPQRCYARAQDAEADGYRRAKR